VVVGRYVDVHKVFSDTQTFASEMPRGPGWEQFNKIMDAQFVTQMDGEQHARRCRPPAAPRAARSICFTRTMINVSSSSAIPG
jgi:hypothetical protein